MKELFIVIISLLLCSAVSAKDNQDIASQSSPTGRVNLVTADEFLVKMFDNAKVHNVNYVESLRGNILAKEDQAAYYLALYIADPNRYKQQYVDNFPTDDSGIMFNYYERIELNRLTPSFLYSFSELGLIAQAGNSKAIEKVIIGLNHSDGVVAEEFCDVLIKTFVKQLSKTVTTLAGTDKGERQKSYSCFVMMEANEFGALKAELKRIKSKATKPEKQIISEIENYR